MKSKKKEESPKGGKRSIKKFFSGFMSGVRSISPSGMRGTSREPSQNVPQSPRGSSGSPRRRVEASDGLSGRMGMASPSFASNPSGNPPKNDASEQLIKDNGSRSSSSKTKERRKKESKVDDHMQRFLHNSLLAAQAAQETQANIDSSASVHELKRDHKTLDALPSSRELTRTDAADRPPRFPLQSIGMQHIFSFISFAVAASWRTMWNVNDRT